MLPRRDHFLPDHVHRIVVTICTSIKITVSTPVHPASRQAPALWARAEHPPLAGVAALVVRDDENGRTFARPAALICSCDEHGPQGRGSFVIARGLPVDGDAHRLAPLADALVADAVDGLVGPLRRRAREWESG